MEILKNNNGSWIKPSWNGKNYRNKGKKQKQKTMKLEKSATEMGWTGECSGQQL